MVEVTTRPISSNWGRLTKIKWKGNTATWKNNSYFTEYIISVSEGLSLSDTRYIAPVVTLPEALHVTSTYWDNIKYTMRTLENLRIVDSASNLCAVFDKESIGVVDTNFANFTKNPNEYVIISDPCSKNSKHRLSEKIIVSGLKSVRPCSNNYDSFKIMDKLLPKLFTKVHLETVDFNIVCSKHKSMHPKESVSVTEKKDVHPNIVSADRLSLQDDSTFHAKLLNPEPINIADKYSDIRIMRRLFFESATIVDRKSNNITKIEKQQFKIIEEYLENSNAVISDIIISTNEIITDVPAGYDSWKPFVSGDYTYKDALIKCEVHSNSIDYNTLLIDYTVYVDLPDIQDHDITNVPAKQYYIPFNLEFYQIPEVTITATGSTKMVLPHIVEVTLEGFYVELHDLDGNLTAGKISWQALGC